MYTRRLSVCVPAYNRPDMLRQLIDSFLRQDYPNKELVISDDSSNDHVARIVSRLNDPRITYMKNPVNLGLSRNLCQAMKLAQGEYVIIMGDDDLFLSPEAISRYVATFDSHPSVSYINCNKAQFSNALAIENIYRTFPRDTVFDKGVDSMRRIWTTSINIAGIGLRNVFDLDRLYPQADYLFPQLEYVGHIINHADSYGIATTLIGIRAHPDQLGFHAIRGERIKGQERHGTVELFTIWDTLARRYMFANNTNFLARDLINQYKTSMLKETLIVGKRLVRANYKHFCAVSPLAQNSLELKLSYWMSQVLPSEVLELLRSLYILRLRWRDRESFALLHKALVGMSAPRRMEAGHDFS